MQHLNVIDPRAGRSRSTLRLTLAAVAVALTLLAVLAHASAARAYEISSFTGSVLRADGSYADQAGEHPDSGVIDFALQTDGAQPTPSPTGITKTIHVDTPAGLAVNPSAFPTCTDEQLATQVELSPADPDNEKYPFVNGCPVDSQVGVQELTVRGNLGGSEFGIDAIVRATVPIYNMTTSAGQAARFAFIPAMAPTSPLLYSADGNTQADLGPVQLIGSVRDRTDYGLSFDISIPAETPLIRAKQTFWGTPGAAKHDPDRGTACTAISADGTEYLELGCTRRGQAPDYYGDAPPLSSADKTTPFLTNPTLCAGKLTSKLSTTTYAGETATAESQTPYGALHCEKLPFAPSVSYGADGSIERDAPMGLKVGLHVPQSQDTGTLGTAHVKDVSATLPTGVSLSPSAANGLEACTDAQFGQGTHDPIACPAGAKVGTASIRTPLLADRLTGSVYVGQPLPGNRYRLLLNTDGHGVTVRLKGTVTPDPKTGQLTATFQDNPQLPFTDLDLQFDGGPRGIVASPQTCGGYTGSTAFSPYSATPTVTSARSIAVAGCTTGFGFNPAFGAKTGSSASGAFSPLSVSLGRLDGDQYVSGVTAKLPAGLLARIRGVTQCSDAQVAAESCPAASRVGTASVTAGPGAAPYGLSGGIYLTGAHGGGQFGFATIIHVVAGPYDLGNVVVRQSIAIDPNDAHVTVHSDPLPQIKEGIPLRLRSLAFDVDRAGFVRNPTSCTTTGRVDGSLTSLNGAVAARATNLTFGGCQNLPFGPKVSLALKNKTQMGKNSYPRLSAVVTQADGEAGLKSTSVALPKDVALAADHASGLCEVAQAAADQCPKASIVGSAVADTPILNQPLKGPVYFVKGERTDAKTGRVIKTLPTLFVPLRGEATIYLRAQTAVSHGRLVTTFPAIPDAPISRFTLNIDGGTHGIIATTRDLCSASSIAGSVRFVGQNGKKAATAKPRISTACGTAKAKAPRATAR